VKLFKQNLFTLLLLLVAATFLAVACNGDGDGDGDGANGTEPTTTDGGDLSDIPEDTTGITDDEILLGSHLPLTGVAGIYGSAISPSIQAYLEFINDTQGGVHGRKIKLLVEDDAYEPPQTNQVVRKLVEQDGVFAMLSGLGTAQHSAVFEYLSENNIPDLFVATGATLFTEPITRTTFGYNPNYIQEGTALGTYVAENVPDAKLGIIIQNDDFGKDGEKGLRAGIEGSAVEVVAVETYEATVTDLTAQVQRVLNEGATVIAMYALPRQAGSVVSVARDQLGFEGLIVASGVVADQLTIALMGGATVENVVTAAYLKPLETEGDAGIDQHIEILAEYAPDTPPSNISVYGQSVAELMVEVLTIAGPDLNRRNVIEAAESVRGFICSVCLAPINLSPTDHRPIETFQFAEARDGVWALFGELISYESTP
jgi:ABC-type branched-subunit amino acid transport system substrate-binding protein